MKNDIKVDQKNECRFISERILPFLLLFMTTSVAGHLSVTDYDPMYLLFDLDSRYEQK